MEDLETERKASEASLNSLKKEVEVGIYRYRNLYKELGSLKVLGRDFQRKSRETGYDNSVLTDFNEKYEKWVDSCYDELAAFLTELVGLLPVVGNSTAMSNSWQPKHQDGKLTVLISVANKLVSPAKGKESVIKSNLVRLLGDNIEDVRSFSALQTHHRKLGQLTERVITGKESVQKEFEQITQALTEMQDYVKAMKVSQDNNHACDSMEDGIEVSRNYYETQTRELETLLNVEPDMEQNMRERIAIRMAVITCKTLLREKFRYSDSRADELMEKFRK